MSFPMTWINPIGYALATVAILSIIKYLHTNVPTNERATVQCFVPKKVQTKQSRATRLSS